MNHSFGRRTGEGTCCSPATIGLFRSRGTSSLGSRPLGLLRTARKHSSAWDRLFGGINKKNKTSSPGEVMIWGGIKMNVLAFDYILKTSRMKKTLLVEPAIFLYVFAYSLTSPLKQQYVYKRIWEETTNSTFIVQDNISHCELNQSNPIYVKQKRNALDGALFACIACLEIVTGTISAAVFNTIYAMTIAWFPGFSFLLSAGFCILPLSLMSWFMYVTRHEENYVQLINEEDCPGQNNCS
ncbi:hypothetical protein E2320_005389 [Naja naja]|nr:hypothetical protein E2320_005389 [Naja naja]